MTDLKLKEFFETDKEFTTTALDYEGIWRILGHIKALHFIVRFYHPDFHYSLDNDEIFEAYYDLQTDLICLLTDKACELNIYDTAGVYEHKKAGNAIDKLNKYFDTTKYFYDTYVPGELTPIPQLKENGAFISGFTEIISALCPDFDMTNLKECVLSYGNNHDAWDNKREENVKNYIDGLEKEANKIIKEIDTMSPKETAYFCGKYSFFLHYDGQKYMRSSIVEAFFVCKSRLPEKVRNGCFADRYAYQRMYNSKQRISDLVILESFGEGLDYTLKSLFYINDSIERVYEALANDTEHNIVLLSARMYR